MRFLLFSPQTAITSLNSVNQLVSVMASFLSGTDWILKDNFDAFRLERVNYTSASLLTVLGTHIINSLLLYGKKLLTMFMINYYLNFLITCRTCLVHVWIGGTRKRRKEMISYCKKGFSALLSTQAEYDGKLKHDRKQPHSNFTQLITVARKDN
jgi:hypothetical protein